MKKNLVVLPALFTGIAVLAHGQAAPAAPAKTGIPTKVAIIHIQEAIVSTGDGQKARKALEDKFTPRKNAIEKEQADFANMQEQLKKGAATMSDAAKEKLNRDAEALQKRIQREQEDFDADVQNEDGKLMNEIGTKMMDVVTKYATQNQIAMVVDVSNPQSPVLWRDPSIDITAEMVKLYNQAHGAAAAAAPAPSGAKPTPTPATAKPPAPSTAKPPSTPPAQKKQ